MKYKLFGKNILPNCAYCENSGNEQGFIVCQKSKVLRDGKCRAFRYDPLLRVPQSVSISSNFTAEDFKL